MEFVKMLVDFRTAKAGEVFAVDKFDNDDCIHIVNQYEFMQESDIYFRPKDQGTLFEYVDPPENNDASKLRHLENILNIFYAPFHFEETMISYLDNYLKNSGLVRND